MRATTPKEKSIPVQTVENVPHRTQTTMMRCTAQGSQKNTIWYHNDVVNFVSTTSNEQPHSKQSSITQKREKDVAHDFPKKTNAENKTDRRDMPHETTPWAVSFECATHIKHVENYDAQNATIQNIDLLVPKNETSRARRRGRNAEIFEPPQGQKKNKIAKAYAWQGHFDLIMCIFSAVCLSDLRT